MVIPAKLIDQSNWNRKELFDFFSESTGLPLYDITTQIDVTHFYHYVKNNNLSFCYG